MIQTLTVATELHQLFERHHEFRRRHFPEWATYDGDHRFDDQLTDLSAAAFAERDQANRAFLKELQALDRVALNPEDQLNYDLFALMLDQDIQAYRFGAYHLAIDQQEGMHLGFPQLIEIQPLETYEHYERYFARLRGFKQQVEDTIANLSAGIHKGIVHPSAIIGLTLGQINDILALKTEEMPFYMPFAQGADKLSEVAQAKVGELIVKIIEQDVRPAYQRLHDFIADVYAPAAHPHAGVWAFPEGEAHYQFLIERYTRPGLTADHIHEMGLQEVARITAEIENLKAQVGFSGSIQEFFAFLRDDPRFYYTDGVQMVADYQKLMDQAYAELPKLFSRLPKAACELKEIEAYRAPSAPQAYYYPPPLSGSRPGYYYINTYDLPSRPIYSMTALTLHEAVPGHHLQLALAQEIENVPQFRYHLDATAFIEGWALYTESLGHEMGMYTDPYQHYGALSFEIWRACRLVVDTGLHAKRWTREQAIAYMRAHTSNSELDIASEVDRYMVLPGQALSYKVGELLIQSLRREAQAQLGEAFDIKAFHEVVLGNGSVPLAVLEQQVRAWMAAQA